ncbi:hypothetical protein AO382_0305 [Moraxella catarrhalis]|uniref:Uncharacterized protein n=1 Tax=Moraxella catarrhalis TaxID=480 RepID=A0A7Z1A4W1_MORCA|nr:hypothetical protein AO382_0305 [Moraxella catarrhalis]
MGVGWDHGEILAHKYCPFIWALLNNANKIHHSLQVIYRITMSAQAADQ